MHDDYHHRFNQTEHVAVLNDTDQTDSATSTRHLLTARTALFICFPTLFIIIGTIGNVVNLIVLYQRSFAQNNMAIALRTLAYLDLLVLWTILGKYAVVAATDWDPLHTDEIYCIAYVCYQFACTTFTNWIIALISLIRYINIKFPFYAQQYLSKRRTYTSLCVIAAVSCAPLIELFEHLHAEHSQTNITGVWSCLDIYFSTNHSYLSKLLLIVPDSFLPGICIVVFNFSTISTYRKVMQKKFGLQNMLNKHVSRIRRLTLVPDAVPSSSAPSELSVSGVSVDKSVSLCSIDEEKMSEMIEVGAGIPDFTVKFRDALMEILNSESSGSHTANMDDNVERTSSSSEWRRIDSDRLLKKEKLILRRIMYEYKILSRLERNSRGSTKHAQVKFPPSRRVTLNDIRRFVPVGRQRECRIRLPPLKILLILCTFLFIFLNWPFAFCFISVSAKPSHTVSFVCTILLLLKYAGNTINWVVYSALSTNFQNELQRLLNKYICNPREVIL